MSLINRIIFILFWGLIISLSLYFFAENVAPYFQGFRSKLFLNNKVWVIAHLVGGTLALFLGPFQFWKKIRVKFAAFHRSMGKLYVVGTFIAGLSGLRLSIVSSCISCRISLFILSFLALAATSLAWLAIRNKNIAAHQQFMIRSYVLVLSFVAVRLDQIIPLDFLFGTIEDPTFKRTVSEYFFSFVPLIVTEIVLTWLPSFKKEMHTSG